MILFVSRCKFGKSAEISQSVTSVGNRYVLSLWLIHLRITQIRRQSIATKITSALSSKSSRILWLSSSISFVDISFRLWVAVDVVLGPAKLNRSIIFVIVFNSSSFFYYYYFFVSQFLFLETKHNFCHTFWFFGDFDLNRSYQ